MISIFVSVNDVRKACLAATSGTAKEQAIKKAFQGPAFFLEYNRLCFHTGVDRETWQTDFLLSVPSALKLVEEFEHKFNTSLQPARSVVSNADSRKYEGIQAVSIPTADMYSAILKSFKKLAKQSKSQALYAESRRALMSAREYASPQDRGPGAVMFLSLDFEWWERADDTILEVGWSLWDTVSRRHRTRHWVVKENLNKSNGRYISDNRSAFLFGTSDKGSLDKVMDALQEEVDKLGISEGLNKQQTATLSRSGVELVLIGHGMSADVDKSEMHEIEWPEGMVKFDTQVLYMAWQLKQLDSAAAAKALEAVVASQNGKAKVAVATVAAVDVHDLDHPSDDDDDDWAHEVGDDDEEPAVAEAAASTKRASSPANTSTPPAGKKKGKPQVQNPPRVRPWPAGPPAADANRPAAALAEEKDLGPPNGGNGPRLDHQVSLGSLCGALGIKTSKLHNAGNDARFTMEAFLALTGHEVCSDPVQAYLDFSRNDPRYQQQLEASIAAAAALGFGTPTEPISSAPNSRSGTPSGSRGWGHTNHNSRSGSTSNSENGSYNDYDIPHFGSGTEAGRPAVPPGFAARAAAPPGCAARGRSPVGDHPPGYAAAAADSPDDDVPPGFQPGCKVSPTPAAAPAAKAWGAGASCGAAPRTGSWAQRAGGGRGPPAYPVAAHGGAAAAGARTEAAVRAEPKPGSQVAWKVDPLAYDPSSSSASGTSGWGAPQPKQAAGFGSAFNSSTGTGNASAGYEPNPDGW